MLIQKIKRLKMQRKKPQIFENIDFQCLCSKTTDGSCEEPRLGLNQLNDGSDRRRVPLHDEDQRIILETILIWFLVFHVCVPECFRNESGVRPYLWAQQNFISIRQSTQNAGHCPAELLEQFLSDSAFNLLRKLSDIFLVHSKNGRVS